MPSFAREHQGLADVARPRHAMMKKLRSMLTATAIIVGSTGLAVLFTDMFVAAEHQRRSIAADVNDITYWFGTMDPLAAGGVGAVVFLVALAFFVRRMA